MYTFIIQKIGEEISSDSATLIESINYNKFIGNSDYQYIIVRDINDIDYLEYNKNIIPIGTIEFVEMFLDKYNLNKENFKPLFLNNQFTKNQKVTNSLVTLGNALEYNKEVFVKPFDTFKSDFSDIYGYIFNKDDYHLFQDGSTYFLSKVLDIISEYRIFVFFNEIKGIYNYSGEITKFLTDENLETIKEMIKSVDFDGLNAYTLDIAIVPDNKIELIEIHPFFSCGLYGFSDYKVIPQMYINGFRFITK